MIFSFSHSATVFDFSLINGVFLCPEKRAYVLEKYGELAELQLEGITKEEFVKNADDSDMTIIRLLASIKKMLSLGASTKDVEKFVKQNIIAEAKQSFQSD